MTSLQYPIARLCSRKQFRLDDSSLDIEKSTYEQVSWFILQTGSLLLRMISAQRTNNVVRRRRGDVETTLLRGLVFAYPRDV